MTIRPPLWSDRAESPTIIGMRVNSNRKPTTATAVKPNQEQKKTTEAEKKPAPNPRHVDSFTKSPQRAQICKYYW